VHPNTLHIQFPNHAHRRRTSRGSSLASAVSFGRVEQSGETSSIKLIHNFGHSSIRRTALDVDEQRRHPRDKTKLQLINIQLFVIEIRSHINPRRLSSSFSSSSSKFSSSGSRISEDEDDDEH
jgi:hypothetical protein